MQVIVIGADWCGMCKSYHPTVVKFAEEHPEVMIKFLDADSDAGDKVCQQYNIRSLPTTIIEFDNGSSKVEVGPKTINELNQLIK